MKAKDVVSEIRAALKQTKEQGHDSVSIDALENYLENFDKDIENDTHYQSLDHEKELARFKAENDRNIAHANNLNSHSIAMFNSVITAGQSALRSSMIINGGGAAALLAFSGKIWTTSVSSDVAASLTSAIFIFCLGVLCAALATGTTYLTQFVYASEKKAIGNAMNVVTTIIVLISYGLFGYGSFGAAGSLGVHFGL